MNQYRFRCIWHLILKSEEIDKDVQQLLDGFQRSSGFFYLLSLPVRLFYHMVGFLANNREVK